MKARHVVNRARGGRDARPNGNTTAELAEKLGGYELLVTGNGAVSRIPLSGDTHWVIGRSDDADLCLPSNSVSRRHAELRLHGSVMTIEDLDSSNGTIVGGQRAPAHSEIRVRPGESVLVGDFVLVLRERRDTRIAPTDRERDEISAEVVLQAPAMVALYEQIEPVARSGINVLILGETGVGKDVLARHLHERSGRSEKPFLQLNCAAFSEPLLESELFGHEKGAFTGATGRKPGLLSTADGGTVFLDEIGELPQRLQAKLLQVFETQQVLSVGGLKPQPIDVRFIAATNRDLEREVVCGGFRSDLYYRLAAFTVVLPPLRERREDILPLCREFVRRASQKRASPSVPSISPEASACLRDHAWPGNIRELRNVIERALILSGGGVVGPEHLPLEKLRSSPPSPSGQEGQMRQSFGAGDFTPKEIEERQRILDALRACAGNQSKAAERLGISRSTLINRLDAYRIERPRKRPG